jgi:hypothetical protein
VPLPSLPFLRLASVVAIGLCLGGCGRKEAYSYKLTLAVNTPEGIKRASSVVKVSFSDVSIPARGTMHKLHGEALYLDLGPGARPLIALLTSQLHPKYGNDLRWSRDAGPGGKLLSDGPILPDLLDYVAQLARARGPHRITSSDLPDLVTFADVNDPATVIEVDPNNLQAALGAGVSWNEITLEGTDESVTTGIEQKLPWLREYLEKNLRLDGSKYGIYGTNRELANILSCPDFDKSGDLKRSK